MPVDFSGKWTIARHDDLAPMLDKLQVPADRRPPAKIENLNVDIKQEGDSFTITNNSPAGAKTHSFTVGDSFELVIMGNMPEVTVTSSWEGDQLVLVDQRGVKLVRKIVDGEIVSTVSAGNDAVSLYFKKA